MTLVGCVGDGLEFIKPGQSKISPAAGTRRTKINSAMKYTHEDFLGTETFTFWALLSETEVPIKVKAGDDIYDPRASDMAGSDMAGSDMGKATRNKCAQSTSKHSSLIK